MKDFKKKVQELLSQKGEELISIMSKEVLSEYELYKKAIKKQDISNAQLHWEKFNKKKKGLTLYLNYFKSNKKNGDVDK